MAAGDGHQQEGGEGGQEGEVCHGTGMSVALSVPGRDAVVFVRFVWIWLGYISWSKSVMVRGDVLQEVTVRQLRLL